MSVALNLNPTQSFNPSNVNILTAQTANLASIATNNAEVQTFAVGGYTVPVFSFETWFGGLAVENYYSSQQTGNARIFDVKKNGVSMTWGVPPSTPLGTFTKTGDDIGMQIIGTDPTHANVYQWSANDVFLQGDSLSGILDTSTLGGTLAGTDIGLFLDNDAWNGGIRGGDNSHGDHSIVNSMGFGGFTQPNFIWDAFTPYPSGVIEMRLLPSVVEYYLATGLKRTLARTAIYSLDAGANNSKLASGGLSVAANFAESIDFTGLAAGNHTLTVTYNDGQTQTITFVIEQPVLKTANLDAKVNLIADGGSQTITLPTPTDCQPTDFYITKLDGGTGKITLDPASGTINGQSTFVFDGANESVHVFFDGTNWHVLSNYNEAGAPTAGFTGAVVSSPLTGNGLAGSPLDIDFSALSAQDKCDLFENYYPRFNSCSFTF